MKCPKCGYLGFEQAERCRNCGYEFALATRHSEPELSLRADSATRDRDAEFDDLDLIDAAAAGSRSRVAARTPSTPTPPLALPADPAPLSPLSIEPLPIDDVGELPLFTDDVPLITKASPPRPPLAVRRATPEVPRLRTEAPRTPSLSFQEPELEMPLEATVSPAVRAHDPEWAPVVPDVRPPAGLGARFAAAAIDLVLMVVVDLAVVYLTMQIVGLTAAELNQLPLGPLLAFLLVQNGGYLVAFTAGGQTIGKMLTGIRVVAAEPGQALDLGRSLQRTLVWAVMALPAGLGLFSALLSPDRRGLHDRFAGTKVVRAGAA